MNNQFSFTEKIPRNLSNETREDLLGTPSYFIMLQDLHQHSIVKLLVLKFLLRLKHWGPIRNLHAELPLFLTVSNDAFTGTKRRWKSSIKGQQCVLYTLTDLLFWRSGKQIKALRWADSWAERRAFRRYFSHCEGNWRYFLQKQEEHDFQHLLGENLHFLKYKKQWDCWL